MNEKTILTACKELSVKVKAFTKIYKQFGPPPLWERESGFATLIYIILEQQVSLASAKATYDKLNKAIKLSPKTFLSLDDKQLKSIGFSQQKTRYCRIVANEILSGSLDLPSFENMDSEIIKEKLMSLTGIGHWTADIYLLMVLLRPDVWPHGDRALAVAAYEVFEMEEVPSYEILREMADGWKPWRSVAARLLWHHYLNTPRRKIPKRN